MECKSESSNCRYLLLRAKQQRVQPTSLFVRYGKRKQCYVAEIFPDEQAPLHHNIQDATSKTATQEAEENPSLNSAFSPDQQQQYCNYGLIKNGLQVILTNIAPREDATHLRFFIENTSSIDLCLAGCTFKYVTFLRKFLFFTKKKCILVR